MLFDTIYSGKHIKNYADIDEDGITTHDGAESAVKGLFPDLKEPRLEAPELSPDQDW